MAWSIARSMTTGKGKGPMIKDFLPKWGAEPKAKRTAEDLEGQLMAMMKNHNAALAASKGK